jgi:hypothetical protein
MSRTLSPRFLSLAFVEHLSIVVWILIISISLSSFLDCEICSLNCKADVDHDIWFMFLEKLWSDVIQVVIRRFQRFWWRDDLDIQPIVAEGRGQVGDNLPRWVDFDVLKCLTLINLATFGKMKSTRY